MRQRMIASIALGAALFAAAAERKTELPEALLGAAIHQEEGEGDLEAAIAGYKNFLAQHGNSRALAAQAQLRLGLCYEKLGNAEARKAYERVLSSYSDQQDIVVQARARLAALEPRAGSSEKTAMATRRIWAGGSVDIEGKPSPDGRYLSYVDWETGDLAIRDLTAGENRRLTNKGSWSESGEYALLSTFSPDGRQVAYTWFNQDDSCDLRIVSAAEGAAVSKPRILYRNDEVSYVQPAEWSPDGKHIAALFTKKDRTNQIALISVADGSARILKTLDWRAPGLSLSPDGRYIAYDFPPKEDSPDRDVFVLAADGSGEFAVVEHPAHDFSPVWTPDGKKLVFLSDRGGVIGAWMVSVAGGKTQGSPELITADLGRVLPMGFTRKGALYYGLNTEMKDIYVGTVDLAAGRIGESPRRIPGRFAGFNMWVDWSPDGRYLAYISRRGAINFDDATSNVVCIRSLESGEERELTPKLGYIGRLRWSPDALSLLVFGKDRKGRQGVYQIDARTGEVMPVVLAEPGTGIAWPDWSTDGRTLYYVRWTGKSGSIVLRDRETGQETELFQSESLGPPYSLSPDGRHIAIMVTNSERKSVLIKIMPAGGGEPRDLSEVPGEINALAWEPDGKALVLVKPGSGNGQTKTAELWRVSAAGGKPEKLGATVPYVFDLRFHPDGRRIAFAGGEAKAEVWVLENFLPTLTAAK